MMDKPKKQFLFNLEWVEILAQLPGQVKYEVYDAIMDYAASGSIAQLSPIAKGVFLFIKKEIDYYNESYRQKSEMRRLAGSKGGKARHKENTQPNQANQANASFAKQNLQQLPLPCINENKPENENETKNENELDLKKSSKKSECAFSKEEKEFEAFRVAYPGTKGGFNTEFKNFKSKYPQEWRNIVPLLMPALVRMENWRRQARKKGIFVPNHAHLSTWINQARWNQEFASLNNNSNTTDYESDKHKFSERRGTEPAVKDYKSFDGTF
ncbi:MAG: DUF6291 domain-containing protein [Prevotella sp.]|nr:DUF6291 domain-containing protein [Prevotella sp.]MCM1074604.1 DUF6291 domain-containing protein [Ruminococcus sp.]